MLNLNQIFNFARKVFCFFYLLIFFPADPIVAQQITFTKVSQPVGSISGIINGMTQDTLGYMWFAVYNRGLYRSDGYQLMGYQNDPKDSTSLASNAIETVYADRNGFIWVGTQKSGLDRLDPNTGIFTHFTNKANDNSSLSDDRVIAILEDLDGAIWVGTHKGLNRMDQKTGTFTRYTHNPSDLTSLSDNQVQVLYEDRRGILWIGTGRARYSVDSVYDGKGGLNRFDKKTGKFFRYIHDAKDSQSLSNNLIGAIFEDSMGIFWVSTAGDGLHTMNRKTGKFERHRYDPAHPEKLSGPPLKKERDMDMNLFFIREDGAGAIWIGASGGWITRYDPITKTVTHYDSFNGDVQAMQAVSGAFTSREGILWLTTWLGNIYQVNPFQGAIEHFNIGSIIHSIHEDASGTIWLGSYLGGLIKYDRKNGSIKRFSSGVAGQATLKETHIEAIYEEDDNTLWIASHEGLYRYNKKKQTFSLYLNDPKNENSLSHDKVLDILEDKPGSIWIATGKGLDHFNIKTGLFRHYKNKFIDSSSLSYKEITSLLKDHSGNLWIGTDDGIVYRFNPQTEKFEHFRCSGSISDIVEDFENIIWVGTTNGLYRSNPGVDSFSRFTDPRIVMTATTVVTAMLEDNQKNLWIGSSAGMLRIDSNRRDISVYNKNQGLDATGLAFSLMRVARGRRGEFLFADKTGYYAFFPDQFKTNTTAPQIVISDFRLADQSVKPGKGSPLSLPISQTKMINLAFNQNDFSIDFAGIHYSSPEDNQHFFMLENIDNTWRRAGTVKTAYYYNVPPGKYVFRVKAANNNGVWAEKAIAILITPPWWTNWWFRVTFAFCSAAMFYILIRWRLHQKFRRQLERTEKEKQFAELQHRTAELEMQALRAQMNPHFIFNSLNSVNMFILENNKSQASEYLSKFSRLVRLILHHSQESFIPLDKELEALQLYLELESLRFDNKFEYKISVKDIDTIMAKVPPLIIQPYAENAIWHGLMQKKEKGHLEIEIYGKEKILICKISDDGIGRERAAELKSKSSLPYKSMGMDITADRLAMLQQHEKIENSVSVKDLVYPDGSPGGTEVLIKLPLHYD